MIGERTCRSLGPRGGGPPQKACPASGRSGIKLRKARRCGHCLWSTAPPSASRATRLRAITWGERDVAVTTSIPGSSSLTIRESAYVEALATGRVRMKGEAG